MSHKIKVIELFAGVGGFRLGLEAAKNPDVDYEIIWSSQWEPGVKKQYASDIYVKRFGANGHSNQDIQVVVRDNFETIPNHDLLVGGFPCQDYSVARTLNKATGLEGKKGVLWWAIYDILNKKGINAPSFLMLENVDRLLKSPVKQRGRDFAIMLSSLASLGYSAEWRVINAADYGFPQRRRRIFILGYKKGTTPDSQLRLCSNKADWLLKDGIAATAFPVKNEKLNIAKVQVGKNPVAVSDEFSKEMPSKSPFEIAGVMLDGVVYTAKVVPDYKGKTKTLADILVDDENIPDNFFINDDSIAQWKYLKGSKNEPRKSSGGHEYFYTEGSMIFPDALDKPSRTIVTGEGGNAPSRFKHVIMTKSGKMRRLTPLELERLNMFPDNHTAGAPDITRAFIMGNALVTGVVEQLGKALSSNISKTAIQPQKSDIESIIPAIRIWPFAKNAENKTAYEQMFLFERAIDVYSTDNTITIHGTYRETCREWIKSKMLYNLPMTREKLAKETILTDAKRLLLTRAQDKPLYFAIDSQSLISRKELEDLGYPVNKKHPAKTTYLLFSLKPCKDLIPTVQTLKGEGKKGKIL
ncbi:MAG: DNA (cytosine-5-)-methyltransferase [Victivallaceae bacterium]